MLIVLNNKCNLNKNEFLNYYKELNEEFNNLNMVICPSPVNIGLCNIKNIKLGCQNVSANENGAYTGEISASQLKSYDVKYCIVGHSERRKYQHETNNEINQKIKQLIKNGIKPILCVGETLDDKKNGFTERVIREEVLSAIEELTEEEKNNIIIAYEPIWAIGTGQIPTIEDISIVLKLIKQLVPNVQTLYGGSANEKNIEQLKNCNEIDGYLLGGISLKLKELKMFVDKI